MKKIITVFAVLFMCSCVFARVKLQANLAGPGAGFNYFYSWNNAPEENGFKVLGVPVAGASVSAFWEFNSEKQQPFHFDAGVDLGLFLIGCYINPAASFEYTLVSFSNLKMELNTTLTAGVFVDIFGKWYFNSSQSVDLILCGSERLGFYGGLGIENRIVPSIDIYQGYGSSIRLNDYLGLRLVAGLRF